MLSILTASTVQAQQSSCTNKNPDCGSNVCVLPWQGWNPGNQIISGTCMTQSEADAVYEARRKSAEEGKAPPGFNNGGTNESNTSKGGALVAPCNQTLMPSTPLTPPQDMYAWWMSRQTKSQATPSKKPEKIIPSSAGTTANGFRAGGPECKYIPSAQEEEFNTCVELEKGKRQPLTDARLFGEYWNSIYKACKRTTDENGRIIYPKPGEMDCGQQKLSGNVFDALWGFLTRRNQRIVPPVIIRPTANVFDAIWNFITHKPK